MSAAWTVICIVTADDSLPPDEIAGIASLTLFDLGAVAVGETAVDGGAVQLLAGFDSETEARRAQSAMTKRFPTVAAVARFDSEHRKWVENQKLGLEPSTIGPWTIRAPWHERVGSQEHDIVIDPGAAFGHGAHPSTQLAIELMLGELDSSPTVVDLGTGTGVIAIIAARMGCTVRATEFEADAIQIARENIERNGVEHLIALNHGDASQSRVEKSDLVVANVTIGVHREISTTYAAADRIVVAGLLNSQVEEIQQLLPLHTAKTVRTVGEWAGVNFLRTAAI